MRGNKLGRNGKRPLHTAGQATCLLLVPRSRLPTLLVSTTHSLGHLEKAGVSQRASRLLALGAVGGCPTAPALAELRDGDVHKSQGGHAREQRCLLAHPLHNVAADAAPAV